MNMRVFPAILIVAAFSAGAAFAADVKAGGAAYATSCRSCHGADGTANPAIAKMMKVDIANLGSAEVQSMSDADLANVITGGKGKMRPVTSVTGASANNVVAYLRSLKK
jgi:mono/diheme cytochrome c family protein